VPVGVIVGVSVTVPVSVGELCGVLVAVCVAVACGVLVTAGTDAAGGSFAHEKNKITMITAGIKISIFLIIRLCMVIVFNYINYN